ncbi:uncharacterized protein LOC134542179 [Bacillus rossius redtenbacheri]|uniref:uncharacterized protein LOC134542179 n=1 Tax=Bacillus rossius redtenbacheri TaxID=93214 RepID=UPI002FDEF457
MESIRLILLITFVSIFVRADNMVRVSGVGELVACDPRPEDAVLYQGSVERARRLLRRVQAELNVSTGAATIHCVRAVDNKGDGNAAEVSVVDGGVGSSRVALRFQSQRGSGIHYTVTVSGK